MKRMVPVDGGVVEVSSRKDQHTFYAPSSILSIDRDLTLVL